MFHVNITSASGTLEPKRLHQPGWSCFGPFFQAKTAPPLKVAPNSAMGGDEGVEPFWLHFFLSLVLGASTYRLLVSHNIPVGVSQLGDIHMYILFVTLI